MEDLITEFVQEFVRAAAREGGRVTANTIYNYVSSNSRSTNTSNTALSFAGILYHMNDGTLLYFSTDGRRTVRGYNFSTWGDQWVNTDVYFNDPPYHYNGGIARFEEYYIDQYGNLYK